MRTATILTTVLIPDRHPEWISMSPALMKKLNINILTEMEIGRYPNISGEKHVKIRILEDTSLSGETSLVGASVLKDLGIEPGLPQAVVTLHIGDTR